MSPEQVRGQSLDTRSDIFSFGVVLYEMVTGVHPFKKDSIMDTAQTILSVTPPPIARYADDVPDLLQDTIRKMLAKDPGERYQTAKGLRIDLRRLNLDTMSESAATVASDLGPEKPKAIGNWMKQWRFWNKNST